MPVSLRARLTAWYSLLVVFERFVRLDPARAAGGSGLGLALARWIAEAHEGTLRVESSSPSGSVFVASLPAQSQTGR
jgi:two-component system, OmpR family, sensor kinase